MNKISGIKTWPEEDRTREKCPPERSSFVYEERINYAKN